MEYIKKFGIFLLISLAACSEKLNDYPFLFISPEGLVIESNRGEYLTFHLDTESDYKLTRFVITEKLTGISARNIFDSTLSGFHASFYYDYLVSDYYTGEEILITFRSFNEEGFETSKTRKILLADTILAETAGQRIYSAKSDNECGFDLLERQSLARTAPDSVSDLRDAKDNVLNDQLSLTWSSPSGGEFVRYNEFDYGNATLLSVKNGFEAGNKLTGISNLAEGDILLIRIDRISPDRYFAVRITRINDPTGVENDYYEFSLKY